jgi:hypothetical protein
MKRIAVVIAMVVLPVAGCRVGGSVAADSSSAADSSAAAAGGTGPAAAGGTGPGAAASGPAPAHCHSQHGLPDRRCTPGATYSAVTQADIGRTICRPGWTATIRPPESYTENLKRQMITAYGYRDRRLHDYEEDHLVPLELGGAPRSARNLWPEYDGGTIPNPKDKVEDALRAAVCDHQVKLTAAQRAIARDWKTAERAVGLAGGPGPAPSASSAAPSTAPPIPRPTSTASAGALSCAAAVSNSRPADDTTVDIHVRTGAGAGVVTVAHYKTTSHQKSATADGRGRATIGYDIGGATRGYRVVVDVTVTRGHATAHCSTSFTPA